MKKQIFYEILRSYKTKPRAAKKIKIIAVVLVIGFLVTGALLITAGVAAFGYVASNVVAVMQTPEASTKVEEIKTELNELPKLNLLSCWGTAQSLMAVEPWLARPALDNFNNLKAACLEEKASAARQQNKSEGEMI